MIRTDASALYIRPEGELTIYRAEELLKQIRGAFDAAPAVVVELEETDKLDTAGFQLIVALQKSCVITGKRFEMTGVGGAVRDFITLYGFKSLEGIGAENG